MSMIVNMLVLSIHNISQFPTAMNNLVASSLLNNIVKTMLNNIVGPIMLLTHGNNVIQALFRQQRCNHAVYVCCWMRHGSFPTDCVFVVTFYCCVFRRFSRDAFGRVSSTGVHCSNGDVRPTETRRTEDITGLSYAYSFNRIQAWQLTNFLVSFQKVCTNEVFKDIKDLRI